MQQIGNRARSVAYGTQELPSHMPQDVRQQALFQRAGSSVASASQLAASRVLEGAGRGLQAAATAQQHIGERIKAQLLGGLAGVALANVRSPAPPMSPTDRMALAIAHVQHKFGTIKPSFAQVQQAVSAKSSDPVTFDKMLDVLSGSKACNVLSFFGALESYRQAPSLDKALAIIDTYISDPKLDDVGGTAFGDTSAAQESKPMDVNLYRATYQAFMSRLGEVKMAVAYRQPDADQQLAGLFDKVAATLQQDLRQVGSSMEGMIRDHRSVIRSQA